MYRFQYSDGSGQIAQQSPQLTAPGGMLDRAIQAFNYAQAQATATGVLDPDTVKLLGADVFGQVAEAKNDLSSARISFESGLTIARNAGLKKAEVTFLFRLGDLSACPYGDVETIGISLTSEGFVRSLIRLHTPSVALQRPSPQELARAKEFYDEASNVLNAVEGNRPHASVILRNAFLARRTGDLKTAAESYAKAAAVAQNESNICLASLSLASESFLTLDRDPFVRADALMHDAHYLGGELALSYCAESWAIRETWMAQNPLRGAACARMGSTVLAKQGFKLEAAGVIFTEAEIANAADQLDRAVELVQESQAMAAGSTDPTAPVYYDRSYGITQGLALALAAQFLLDGDQGW